MDGFPPKGSRDSLRCFMLRNKKRIMLDSVSNVAQRQTILDFMFVFLSVFDHVIVIKRTFPQSSINKLKFYVTYGICFVLPKQGCSCWYGVFRVKEFGSQV